MKMRILQRMVPQYKIARQHKRHHHQVDVKRRKRKRRNIKMNRKMKSPNNKMARYIFAQIYIVFTMQVV